MDHFSMSHGCDRQVSHVTVSSQGKAVKPRRWALSFSAIYLSLIYIYKQTDIYICTHRYIYISGNADWNYIKYAKRIGVYCCLECMYVASFIFIYIFICMYMAFALVSLGWLWLVRWLVQHRLVWLTRPIRGWQSVWHHWHVSPISYLFSESFLICLFSSDCWVNVSSICDIRTASLIYLCIPSSFLC